MKAALMMTTALMAQHSPLRTPGPYEPCLYVIKDVEARTPDPEYDPESESISHRSPMVSGRYWNI